MATDVLGQHEAGTADDLSNPVITAQFPELETPAQPKRLVIGAASNGANYGVWFEVSTDIITALARMVRNQIPISLEWQPEDDEAVLLSESVILKPSSLTTDADGAPHFIAKFQMPMSDIGRGLGLVAVGLRDGHKGVLRLRAMEATFGLEA